MAFFRTNSELKSAQRCYAQGKEALEMGEFSQATRLFEESVRKHEMELGKFHHSTIKSYYKCGKAACYAGESQLALRSFFRALRMTMQSLDASTHPQLWQDIQKCWNEAYPSESHILPRLQELVDLEEDGDRKCKREEFEKAAETYQSLLQIEETLLSNSLDAADIRCKLAVCLLRTNKIEQAQECLETARSCFLEQLGEQHPATLGAQASLRTIQGIQRKADSKKNTRKGSVFLNSQNRRRPTVEVAL